MSYDRHTYSGAVPPSLAQRIAMRTIGVALTASGLAVAVLVMLGY